MTKSFLWFSIIVFILGIIFVIPLLISKRPIAILDKNGIWVKHFAFIPWNDIDKFTSYLMSGSNAEVIGINVKNPKVLSKKSGLGGKMGIFWAKIFNNYHITISSVDKTNEEILCFAKQYIKIDY